MINWICISILAVGFGFFFTDMAERLFHFREKRLIFLYLGGLLLLNLYAEVFSIFYRVSLGAYLCALFLSILSLVIYRKKVFSYFEALFSRLNNGLSLLYLSECLILALISAGPVNIRDAYLYHIPTIKSIHEQGVIKGMANEMIGLGFNGALHCLTSLSDWTLLGEKTPLHTVSGLYLLLLTLYITPEVCRFVPELFKALKTHTGKVSVKNTGGGENLLSGFNEDNLSGGNKDLLSSLTALIPEKNGALKLCSVVFILISTAWISSPVLDMPVQSFLLLVLILWLENMEDEKKNKDEKLSVNIVLSFFITYAVTIKLSMGITGLLILEPLFLLLKDRRFKEVLSAGAVCVSIVLPYLARNYFISGWLLFPSAFPDIFDPIWKVPKKDVRNAAYWVTEGSRNPLGLDKTAYSSWLIPWLKGSSKLKWILYAVLLIFFILSVYYLISCLIKKYRKKEEQELSLLYFYTVLLAGLSYWFIVAPDTRFGWIYIIPVLGLFPLIFEGKRSVKKGLFILSAIALLSFGGFYLFRTLGLTARAASGSLVFQIPFEKT